MREKNNIIIFLLIIILVVNIYGFFVFSAQNYLKINKKINHRYFNTVKTMEQVYGVEINTLNGEVKVKN